MPSVLMLVLALQSGTWQCQQNDRGLWECRVPTRTNAATAPAPAPSSTTPAATDAAVASEAPVAAPAAVADREEPPPAAEVSNSSTTSGTVSVRESVPASGGASAGAEAPPASVNPVGAVDQVAHDIPAPLAGAPYNAFVVQVGAFRSEQRARRAVRAFGLSPLAIMPTRRGDEEWYVLLLGSYPDIESANSAGQSFVEAHPGAGYWVRNAAELRDVKP